MTHHCVLASLFLITTFSLYYFPSTHTGLLGSPSMNHACSCPFSLLRTIFSNIYAAHFFTSFRSSLKCHFLIRSSLSDLFKFHTLSFPTTILLYPVPLLLFASTYLPQPYSIIYFPFYVLSVSIFPHLTRTEIFVFFSPTDVLWVFMSRIKPGT